MRPDARRRCGRSSKRSGTARATTPLPTSTGRPIATASGVVPRLEARSCAGITKRSLTFALDIDELIVAGDTVVLRATIRGTDTGGYVGRPPTGRAVEEWVVTVMHFEHDRVVRKWVGADKLGLFIQLGVVANPWPA